MNTYACVGLAHAVMFVGRHVTTASVCDVSECSCGGGEKSEYVCGDTLRMGCVVGNGDAKDCCAAMMFVVCCEA